jgi:hypothetical protein
MIREVSFIRGLDIATVPLYEGQAGVPYHELCYPAGLDAYIALPEAIEFKGEHTIHIAPVHHIHRAFNSGRYLERTQHTDTYIAYSKEVQKLLGMPFDTLREENSTLEMVSYTLRKDLEEKNIELENLRDSFWARMKFLFTKKIN